MAFREYKLGAMFFGFALSFSMMITLFFPTLYITDHGTPDDYGLDKTLTYGRNSAFTYSDPLLKQTNEPIKAILKVDPANGKPLASPMTVYIYQPGDPFPSNVVHPSILTGDIETLSVNTGKIDAANVSQGAVFTISHAVMHGKELPYIQNLTATKGWQANQTLAAVPDHDRSYAAQGRTLFEREGCWWCHTLLPEETQDWETFGRPPLVGDLNGQSPTTFGSDRKAPDLLHVGSRNSSREWMTMHFFDPRLVQPHSIMPRFDYLWGKYDASGHVINYAKWRKEYMAFYTGHTVYPPAVPIPAKDSEARHLIDFVLDLK